MKKLKRVGILFMSSVFLLSSIGTASAMAINDFSVNQNNTAVNEVAEPIRVQNDKSVIGEVLYDTHIHVNNVDDKDTIGVQVQDKEGILMLPLRVVAESLGFDVTWGAVGHQTVELSRGAQYIQFKIGENNYFYGKMAPIELLTAPELIDGSTFVPIDFISILLKSKKSIERNEVVLF
ncbi:copper amine oxidase N-terminal domain-containing protein (plasmid) [Paenibacillus thiaminolyticus]|uniref:copper amine oxidase N-terminal domain-containing protein n=1 Tax=Paenibacillus thiaminolyticus TaxID=49283 RepID=UPI00232C3BD1|nr:copper amine oxidase N-terminal domain-containing protein [Paenibacillus thiaminolyticus]WCF11709.1 copper amine oxidase N-terminal domain-containing protein [Paenibacillus thiaminolyticus]